jgi:hypothetical protein
MKAPLILSCVLLLLAPLRAEMVMTGVIALDGDQKATFKDTADGKESSWLGQGGTFNGYVVKSISTKDGSATLLKDGRELLVRLQASTIQKMAEPPVPPPAPGGPLDLSKLSDEQLHSRGFHRTGKGDTGATMARRMGITLAELRRLNPDVNFARLEVGQILRFKAQGVPPPPPVAKASGAETPKP